MEVVSIIGSTYERRKNACISDIFCAFTLMHISNDSLNATISKVHLKNWETNAERYLHGKDNVSFHGALEKQMLYHNIAY